MNNFLERVSSILFKNTGSTTEILEAVTGGKVEAKVLLEETYHNDEITIPLGYGSDCMLRVTTLSVNGKDVSDNIIIYDPNKLVWNQLDFKNRHFPIGKLLNAFDSHRELEDKGIYSSKRLLRFYKFKNLTFDSYPIKEYKIVYNNEVQFYIIELYLVNNIKDLINF